MKQEYIRSHNWAIVGGSTDVQVKVIALLLRARAQGVLSASEISCPGRRVELKKNPNQHRILKHGEQAAAQDAYIDNSAL